MIRNISFCLIFFVFANTNGFAQQSLTDLTKHMHHHEKGKLKQVAYEFLSAWNSSAELVKPASDELSTKIKENKQKGKDPYKGTEKLKQTYDAAVYADGVERSFLAETFGIPILHEMKTKGSSLDPSDIYTAQYVLKFIIGVPKFNHGHLDIDDLDSMDKELADLIAKYPDNDAHNQEVDGHIIDVFREEANGFFDTFVAANKAEYEKDQGSKKPEVTTGLTQMNCGEKYELLKEKGLMH